MKSLEITKPFLLLNSSQQGLSNNRALRELCSFSYPFFHYDLFILLYVFLYLRSFMFVYTFLYFLYNCNIYCFIISSFLCVVMWLCKL